MNRYLHMTALAVTLAGTAAAQDPAGRPPEAKLEPEILALLAGSGLLDAALHGAPQARAAARLPDQRSARSGFEASFSGQPGISLDSLDCGDGGCDAVLSLGDADPLTRLQRIADVEAWLADISPCGYTLTAPGIGAPEGQLRAQVRCAE
jgi:hypothetical protein